MPRDRGTCGRLQPRSVNAAFEITGAPRSFALDATSSLPGSFQIDVTIVSPGKNTPAKRA